MILYSILPAKDYEVVRQISDRHFILKDTESGLKKFLKLLRLNSLERGKELIPELFTEKILSLAGVSRLNTELVSSENKPGILMNYFPDLVKPVRININEVTISDREYFASALFLIDLITKNTNRHQGRLDHMGWEDTGSDSIALSPLDNGNTMGHPGDENLDNDDDLNNESFSQHVCSLLIEKLTPESVEKAVTYIESLDFEKEGQIIKDKIFKILVPTEEEKKFISERFEKIISMLNRRRSIAIELVRRMSSPVSVMPSAPPQEVGQPAII